MIEGIETPLTGIVFFLVNIKQYKRNVWIKDKLEVKHLNTLNLIYLKTYKHIKVQRLLLLKNTVHKESLKHVLTAAFPKIPSWGESK